MPAQHAGRAGRRRGPGPCSAAGCRSPSPGGGGRPPSWRRRHACALAGGARRRPGGGAAPAVRRDRRGAAARPLLRRTGWSGSGRSTPSSTLVGASDPFRNDRIDEHGNAALADRPADRPRPRLVWLDLHRLEPRPGRPRPRPAPARARPRRRCGRGAPDPDGPIPATRQRHGDGDGASGRRQDPGAAAPPNPLWRRVPAVAWALLVLLAARGRARWRWRGPAGSAPPVAEPLPVLVPVAETVTGPRAGSTSAPGPRRRRWTSLRARRPRRGSPHAARPAARTPDRPTRSSPPSRRSTGDPARTRSTPCCTAREPETDEDLVRMAGELDALLHAVAGRRRCPHSYRRRRDPVTETRCAKPAPAPTGADGRRAGGAGPAARRGRQGGRRPGRGRHRSGDRAAVPRPRAARRRAGRGEDAARAHPRRRARPRREAAAVHPRPDARRRHRLADLRRAHRGVRVPGGPGLHEPAARRRDQPDAAEDPGRRCWRSWRSGRSPSRAAPRRLPEPFVVAATQNPIEYEGTYPLPEAQLDRFLLKLTVPLPTRDEELGVLRAHHNGFDPRDLAAAGVGPVATAADLAAGRAARRPGRASPTRCSRTSSTCAGPPGSRRRWSWAPRRAARPRCSPPRRRGPG